MNFQIASDLHLEFPENRKFLKRNPLIPKASILLLAGDIMPIHKIDNPVYSPFIDYFSDHFERTYWIPGNHEFYAGDLLNYQGAFKENIRANVYLLNNQVVMERGTELIMSTLWTKISKENTSAILGSLNDYKVIELGENVLTPEDTTRICERNIAFLQSCLKQEKKGKRIVLTHHVPTLQNYPAKYLGDVLNEAFAVDLEDMIKNADIDYWIFGHHHANVQCFQIGGVTMLTNQLGYAYYEQCNEFDAGMVIP